MNQTETTKLKRTAVLKFLQADLSRDPRALGITHLAICIQLISPTNHSRFCYRRRFTCTMIGTLPFFKTEC